MIWLLKEWKLSLAGLFLISALSVAGYAKYQTHRLEVARQDLAACKANLETWQQATTARDAVIDELKAAVERNNVDLDTLRAAGEATAARLADALKEIARRRHELEAANGVIAELSKPLPPGCSARLRETARRLKAMLSKGDCK